MNRVATMTESPVTTHPHVYIILLNWNGWRDTIECLESVFRLSYPCYTVLVCDNASADGSLEKIERWASGDIAASCSSPELSRLVSPLIPKPLEFLYVASSDERPREFGSQDHLVLIQTGANLGFAGGNNVGIRYALARGDCDYVWLLNNDTVVEPEALSEMVRMTEADSTLGVCGSLLRSYASPGEILTAGGRRYSRWSGRTRPLRDASTPQVSTTPSAPDYVEGASMLISRRLLEQTGLLEESYFLYFEELDLICRATPEFRFGYSPASIVYHKEGASIGSAHARANRSVLSEFYLARNRLIFTRRHYPWLLPSVLVVVAASAVMRMLIGKPRNATGILRGVLASFREGIFRVRTVGLRPTNT